MITVEQFNNVIERDFEKAPPSYHGIICNETYVQQTFFKFIANNKQCIDIGEKFFEHLILHAMWKQSSLPHAIMQSPQKRWGKQLQIDA